MCRRAGALMLLLLLLLEYLIDAKNGPGEGACLTSEKRGGRYCIVGERGGMQVQ